MINYIFSSKTGPVRSLRRLAGPSMAAALCCMAGLVPPASAAPGDDWVDSSAIGESFDDFPVANVTTLAGRYGTFAAASGHAAIVDMSGRGFGHSLKINGASGNSGPRSVTLTFPSDLEEDTTCAFRAERWTSGSPLDFNVYYLSGSGEKVLLLDASSAEVSNNGTNPFPSSFQGIVPAGARGIVFECARGSAVMVDHLLMGADADAEVTILAKNWPVMKNLDINGILRFNLGEAPLSYYGMAVEVDLSSSSAVNDIESVSLYTPGSINDSSETILTATQKGVCLATASLDEGGRAVLQADTSLLAGETAYTFWISVKLKSSASLDDKIGARLVSVTVGGAPLGVPEVPAAVQRIGYAVACAGDKITGGPTEGKVSHFFRIPGIARAANGDLVAVYDIRYDSSTDLPRNIDVGRAISRDGGQTWTDTAVAINYNPDNNPAYDYHRSYGVGDPAILLDEYSGTMWIAAIAGTGLSGSSIVPDVTSRSTCQYVLAKSEDNGVTWEPCKSINTQVRSAAWKGMFEGPGHGITVKGGKDDGVLVFPSQIWSAGGGLGTPQSCLIYSRDHGQTWVSEDLKKTDAPNGTWGIGSSTSECAVAQLSDGSLMLNAKDEGGSGYRAVFTTKDLGATWQRHPTDRKATRTLREPRCQGSLFSVLDSGRMSNVLFFSNPDSGSRRAMTLKTSLDDGMTWPKSRQIQYDSRLGAGYSDICQADDDHIGVLYEGLQGAGYIFFLRIPVSEVLSVLFVDTTNISVPASGAVGARLPVTCDAAWTAASSADWLTLSASSGDGDGEVVYSAAPFTGEGTREATISVASPGLKSVSVRVVQSESSVALTAAPEKK